MGIPTFLRIIVGGRFLVNNSSVDVPHGNREPWILEDTQPELLANLGGLVGHMLSESSLHLRPKEST